MAGDKAHGSSDGCGPPKSSARAAGRTIGAFRAGYRTAVWWALGVVVVIAVGLPLTLGLATRGMASRPPRPFRPGYGKNGQWLHEQYGLDWRACVRIERAVTRGQRVEDPALEDAAHGLAALIISGRAPGQRLLRTVGYGSVTLGVGCLVAAIVAVCLGHHAGETPLLIPYALFVTANAWFQQIWGPRRQRRQAAQALDLNRRAAAARLSFGQKITKRGWRT